MKLRFILFVTLNFIFSTISYAQVFFELPPSSKQLDSIDIQVPFPDTNENVIVGKLYYSYLEGYLTKREFIIKPEPDSTLKFICDDYKYEAGKIIEEKESLLNIFTETGDYITTLKKHSYENDNLVQSEVFDYVEESKTWEKNQLITYEYNDNNELFRTLIQSYNDEELVFENEYLSINSYENGVLVDSTIQAWSLPLSKWYDYEKFQYQYNDDNQITEELYYEYFNDEWTLDSKVEYFYNENNLLSEKKTYEKVNGGNAIMLSMKALYYYDEDNDVATITEYGEPNEMGDFQDVLEYVLFYNKSVPTQISETSENDEATVFPNPSSDFIFINFDDTKTTTAKLKLYDLEGKLILDSKVFNEEPVELLNVPNGSYIYSVEFNNVVKRGKLVKK